MPRRLTLSALAGKKIREEDGVALMLSLVILTVLSLLGASAIITSQIDMEIAANEKVGIQAQYAAEAGLSQAIAMLNISSSAGKINPPSVNWGDDSNWAYSFKRTLTKEDNATSFFNVSVAVSFKKDGQCQNMVTFYNHTCGFPPSIASSGGVPVYKISATGYKDDYSSTVALELTRQQLNYQIKGGFSANGTVELNGTATLDGNPHDANGNPGGTCNDPNLTGTKPGVYTNGSTIYGGTPTVSPAAAINQGDAPTTPWDTLGINEEQFNDLFGSPVATLTSGQQNSLSEYTYVSGGIGSGENGAPNLNGSGILVVHNPLYSPGSCLGEVYDNLDPVHECHSSKAPAKMNSINGGTFRGIVIADQVELRGNVTIIGALVSLSSIQTTATGAGTPEVLYSCEAIEAYGGGKLSYKLNWKRVY